MLFGISKSSILFAYIFCIRENFKFIVTDKYQTYYQWVGLVLFLQAASFYAPRLLWTLLEGGRAKQILRNVEASVVVYANCPKIG